MGMTGDFISKDRAVFDIGAWGVALALCWCCLGCASTVKVPPAKPGSYPAAEKIALPVELRMSEKYRHAAWSQTLLGSTTTIDFGDTLAVNTEGCIQALFSQHVSTSASRGSPPTQGTAAVLTPQVTEVNVVIPGGGVSKIVTTLTMEMTLEDGAGEPVWVNTFKTESRGPIEGTSMKPNRNIRERFDFMVRDVLLQAFNSMAKSPEIKAFALRAVPMGTKPN